MRSLTAFILPLALISHAALALDPVFDSKPIGPAQTFEPFEVPMKIEPRPEAPSKTEAPVIDDKFSKPAVAPETIDPVITPPVPTFPRPETPPKSNEDQKTADQAVIDEHFGKAPKGPAEYTINPTFSDPIGLDPLTLRPIPTGPGVKPAGVEKASEKAEEASVPGPRQPITLYAAGNYRLRTGPWKRIQLIIPRGAKFSLLRKEGDWYVVEYNGKTGYVHESGITHPLAEAIRKQKAFSQLTENEAAEIAACVSLEDTRGLPRDLQEFVQSVQAELLPYIAAVEPQEGSLPGRKRKKGPPVASATPAPKKEEPKPAPRTGRNASERNALEAEIRQAASPRANPAPSARRPARADESEAPSGRPASEKPKVTRKSVTARSERLAEACWNAATKYRLFAPHVCKRRGSGYPCGGSDKPYKSKGWCGAGSKECLSKAVGLNLSAAGDSFSSKKRTLDRMTTKAGVDSCEAAPVGSICIYTASYHSFGHIEVKILRTDPKTGLKRVMYCSDYCAAHPVKGRHTFQGAYLP